MIQLFTRHLGKGPCEEEWGGKERPISHFFNVPSTARCPPGAQLHDVTPGDTTAWGRLAGRKSHKFIVKQHNQVRKFNLLLSALEAWEGALGVILQSPMRGKIHRALETQARWRVLGTWAVQGY